MAPRPKTAATTSAPVLLCGRRLQLATLVALAALSARGGGAAGAARGFTPTCPSRTDPADIVVVLHPKTPYYSWGRCNDLRGGQHTAVPANASTHVGVVTTLDVQQCNLDCLDEDAFQFEGAADVTRVFIQQNNFRSLPERLLWNMTALKHLFARSVRPLSHNRCGQFS